MENLKLKNGTIIFTDLKDFTLKTSLLTQKQIDILLETQDKIILKSIKNNSGKLIKTIGDSYMVFFSEPINALKFSIEIQKETYEYNKLKTLKLQKIEIRLAMNYGQVSLKKTTNGYDYFGDCVNLASRVLDKTLENKIFFTDKFYEKIKEENFPEKIVFLGKTSFKGILYEVNIYELLYLPEDLHDVNNGTYKKIDYSKIIIDDKIKTRYKNIEDIIFKGSCISAVLGVQPIPFFDIYTSIAVYVYMLTQISKEYNIKLGKKETSEILVTILGAIGSALFINQTINTISKIGFLGLSGFLLVPLNFATTYGVGKVINRYFYNKTKDLNFTNEEIKELFLSSKDYGLKYAKSNKKEIIKIGNKFKKEFLEIGNNTKKDLLSISKEIKKMIKK